MSSLLFFSPVLMAICVGMSAQMGKGRTGAFYWLLTVVLSYLIAIHAIPSDAQMIAMGNSPMGLDDLCWPIGGVVATLVMLVVVATLPDRRAEPAASMELSEDGLLVPSRPKTRPCPHCAEDILRAASVCKHCGRDVEPMERRCTNCGAMEKAPALHCIVCGNSMAANRPAQSSSA